MFCCLNVLPLQICMGMCPDISEEDKRAKIQSSQIEQALNEHARAEINTVKILLLGAAESGKSTVIKQIKIIHSNGFSKEELMTFKPAVLDNLLTSMKVVLQGMGILRINLANQKNKVHACSILSCSQCLAEDLELHPFIAHAFCALWADLGVKAAAARGYEFELNDSAFYFFENISRIIAPNYVPTETDVLRVRVRTCGIIETQFQVNEMTFRLYDVGGQRSERRKWLHCFDSVHAVLFVVALSSFDMKSMEDPTVSRLQESLQLFSSVCSNTIFQKASMILFLNKMDLFRKKIQHSGRLLRFYFSSYKGADGDVDAAACLIADMFFECNNFDRPIYHHFTTATNTANVQAVLHVVFKQVIEGNLASFQLF
ncbi:hypothetical protein OJAV_G00079080 [Oryzias javanicus]|uniref:Guanine nucleotide-binding protein G(O) subunit alpha n=1 Tax=Oryzias javanicus TaxID=123683 RepID=A0A3S2UF32_ORYJA|nr:hypothetical protein OJAV_G00079080 [Oryzias javanicus]